MKVAPTRNNLCPWEVISGLQKHIRRGEEKLAMQAASEMMFSGTKGHCSWLLNRLEVMCLEDIGIGDMQAGSYALQLIATARENFKQRNPAEDPSFLLLAVANIILALCRAQKARIADHLIAAVAYPVKLGEAPYQPPDYAFDKHTRKGRAMRRGIDHFRESSAQLSPAAPSESVPDPYVEDAYQMWKRLEADRDLFDSHTSNKGNASPQKEMF